MLNQLWYPGCKNIHYTTKLQSTQNKREEI